MILVDIGNSGLRALASESALGPAQCASDPSSPVIKLSWSAMGEQILKSRPLTKDSQWQRWSQIGEAEGLKWFVTQFGARAERTWRIASVNRMVQEKLVDTIRQMHPHAEIQLVTYQNIPMAAKVDFPERLGVDRLLAARGALHCMRDASAAHSPMIVVQAGTALTVDWVDEAGDFCGGAILPGMGLSLQYLAAGTDQLPWLPSQSVAELPTLPGKNTEQAIAAGVHASVVGGARYLIDRYRNGRPIPVVISGGDGPLLLHEVAAPVHVIENLVLIGLSLPLKSNS